MEEKDYSKVYNNIYAYNMIKLYKSTFLFIGGGAYLLGVQCLTVVCLALWSFTISIILLWVDHIKYYLKHFLLFKYVTYYFIFLVYK